MSEFEVWILGILGFSVIFCCVWYIYNYINGRKCQHELWKRGDTKIYYNNELKEVQRTSYYCIKCDKHNSVESKDGLSK